MFSCVVSCCSLEWRMLMWLCVVSQPLLPPASLYSLVTLLHFIYSIITPHFLVFHYNSVHEGPTRPSLPLSSFPRYIFALMHYSACSAGGAVSNSHTHCMKLLCYHTLSLTIQKEHFQNVWILQLCTLSCSSTCHRCKSRDVLDECLTLYCVNIV